MFYEPSKTDHGLPHDPFLSCVVPRPIGWITTKRGDVVNLAPFSFFTGVGVAPPQVMFCVIGDHVDGGPKDTLRNTEETGEFVVNVATMDLREQMNLTAAYVAREVSEPQLADLAMVSSYLVTPPRVQRSPIHLECRHLLTVRLPSTNPAARSAMVVGTVVGVHINDDVLTNGLVDINKLRPIARLGYLDYCVIDEVFPMQRPKVGGRGFHLIRDP